MYYYYYVEYPELDSYEKILEGFRMNAVIIISLTISFAFGLFMNILVITSFAKFSELRNTLTTFLFCIAVSHLVPLVLKLPFQIWNYLVINWIFVEAMCKLVSTLGVLISVFTTGMLFIMAIYMMMEVKFTRYGKTLFQQHHVWKYSIVVAIVSCLVCLPVFFAYNVQELGIQHKLVICSSIYEELFTFNRTMLGLLVALLLIMMVFDWTAYRGMKSTPGNRDAVHFRMEPDEKAAIIENETENNSSISIQDVKMIWVISVVNALVQFPYWLKGSISFSTYHEPGVTVFLRILYISEFVLYLIFPVIYGIVSPQFRTCYRKLICCCCRN
ncbi:hypothetical protein ScPMuIL_005358 [Solemya velum]